MPEHALSSALIKKILKTVSLCFSQHVVQVYFLFKALCSVHCGRPIPNRSLAKLLGTELYCVRCWKQRSFSTSKQQGILGKLVKYLACGRVPRK